MADTALFSVTVAAISDLPIASELVTDFLQRIRIISLTLLPREKKEFSPDKSHGQTVSCGQEGKCAISRKSPDWSGSK